MNVIKLLFKIVILFHIHYQNPITEYVDVILESSNNIELNFSIILPYYERALKIPENKLKYYQIEAGELGNYTVDGSSVTVDNEGMVRPKNITKYFYMDGTIEEIFYPDKELLFKDINYITGISTVLCKVGNNTFNITINVTDYAKEYANDILDKYIETNVKNKSTLLEKLYEITSYVSSFPYNAEYNDNISYIVFNAGENWAALDVIIIMARKIGINPLYRFSDNDDFNSSLKIKASLISLIDDKFYVIKLLYNESNFTIYEIPKGYSYHQFEDTNNIVIYQYNGNEEEIFIPDKLDDKKVVGINEKCFYNGIIYNNLTIKKIIIPEGIEFLGNNTFYHLNYLEEVFIPKTINKIGFKIFDKCNALKNITVDENNKKFSSIEGVLYNKNKTNLIIYPQGNVENFTGQEPLELIEEYSFYDTIIENISFPKTLKYIKGKAFEASNIKEIKFEGDPPFFEDNVFNSLNLTVYYPGGNDKWNESIMKEYGSSEIRWKCMDELDEDASNVIVWILIVVGILVILGAIGYIIIKKAKEKSSSNIDTIGREGLLNERNDIPL